MNAEKTLVNDMSQGPVLKGLIRFAIPMMLANLLQAVYSMVDMIVVGQFGGPGWPFGGGHRGTADQSVPGGRNGLLEWSSGCYFSAGWNEKQKNIQDHWYLADH